MGVWAAVINHVSLQSDMSVRTKVVKVMKAFILLLILVLLYCLLKRHFNYLSNKNVIWKSVEPCGCFRPVDLSTNDQFINSTTCSRVSPINQLIHHTNFMMMLFNYRLLPCLENSIEIS